MPSAPGKPGAASPGAVRAGTLAVDFETVRGDRLTDVRIAYRTYGDVEAARVHGWILVIHSLTGGPDVDAWWGPLLGAGRAFDTSRHAVLAINLPGSCYGSDGPREWRRRGRVFPVLTPRDLARAHEPVLAALGVERVALATGGSLGGMVALEWASLTSVPTDRVVVFAAPAASSPQAVAWNVAQRMAIEADGRWRGGAYPDDDPPMAGLAAARALAMVTYRSAREFAGRFPRQAKEQPGASSIERYLRHHGDRLVARFDAESYVALTHTMDLHDVGDLAAAARQTAARVGTIVGVGVDTDILYPAMEVRAWVDAYAAAGAPAVYREISSPVGHDGFLVEVGQVARAMG